MLAHGSGAMVFIGSVLSHRANRQFAHYTAAKHGVLGLMRAFALELAPHMIRVNSVDPTVVETDMVMNQAYLDRLVGRAGATPDDAQAHYLNWNTLPVPWIEPVDVANAVSVSAVERGALHYRRLSAGRSRGDAEMIATRCHGRAAGPA